MVSAVKKEEIYKRMGLSLKDVDAVRKDVKKIIQLVGYSAGIKISEKELPNVDIIPGDSSAYDRGRNIIFIAKDKIGSGESYAAEAGHFLRSYATHRLFQPQNRNLKELKIEEFFDRATYVIAKEKSMGTNLGHLFKEDSVDYSGLQGRKKLAGMIKSARIDLKKARKIPGYDKSFNEENAKQNVLLARSHASYARAEQYSANDFLSAGHFYSLPNDEIRRRFFHRKRGNLEKIVQTLLYIISPFFLIYLLFNLKLTGFVISNTDNIIFRGALWVFLAFFITLLFLRFWRN